jgi:hypothetical protein
MICHAFEPIVEMSKSRKARPKDQGLDISKEVASRIYESARDKVESLWYASLDGDLGLVKKILEEGNHGVDGLNRWQTDMDPNGWRRTPLHAAALKDHVKLAEFLISRAGT